jgi:FlaA1/EpsC-like NDP-sugar epimerase
MYILNSFFKKLLLINRFYKKFIVFFTDIIISILCVWISFSIRYESYRIPLDHEVIIFYIAILIFIPVFLYFKIYNIVHQHLGLSSLLQIIFASFFNGVIFFLIIIAFEFSHIPRSIGIIYPVLFSIFILLSRIIINYLINESINTLNLKNVLIYGTGKNSVNAAKIFDRSLNYRIKGFIDIDGKRHGELINNVSIYHPDNLSNLIKKHSINNIIIDFENPSNDKMIDIVSKIEKYNVEVKKIPKGFDLINNVASVKDFKELDIKDLIDRDIKIENSNLKNISEKVIFVSGAGGSIGSEICKELINHCPEKIILYDHSEYNLYKIEGEIGEIIKYKKSKVLIISILGNIRDYKNLKYVFNKHKPNYLFHVAAYKHVPIVENNILEAVANNIFGTQILVDIAKEYLIKSFTLISTDKAVRPTNIMGATKRVSELIVQSASKDLDNKASHTNFSIVRFGNVLGSSGSVVPLFYKQIKEGGPITVTHKDIVRYFMTIKEAAILVLQTTTLYNNNDVFVLDMGKPIKIIDLAKKMIMLSGLKEKNENNRNGDINIEITNLRPGEKLYEELNIDNQLEKTEKAHILKSYEEPIETYEIEKIMEELNSSYTNSDINKIKLVLQHQKIGYKPNENEI